MTKRLVLILFVFICLHSCEKARAPYLSEKNIKIVGSGTTFYNDADYLALVDFTDTSKIPTILELKTSMNGIAEIVLKYKDRAGAFPVLYNVVTNVAYETLSNMNTEYAAMGKAFMNEFGKHFLRNFHSYLLGETIEPVWQNYFQRVANNSNSILHLGMSGINAHITYDIPFVLDDINAEDGFLDDFTVYTDFIASTYPQVAEELNKHYNIQMADEVFKLFFIGDILDAANGQGFTTHLVIDILRTQSWNRGLNLQNNRTTFQQTHNICLSDFKARENILQSADNGKLLY